MAGPIRIAVLANASQAVNELGRTERAAKGLGSIAGSVFKGGLGVAAVTGAAGVAFGAVQKVTGVVGRFAGGAIEASDATDKFKSTLDFAGLDTGTIERLTASTQKYADQTVYSLGDIQGVTAQLAANGVQDYDKLAEAAGNLNAVAGGNAETFKSVGMVLTQTAGQGKLTTENFNQLSDAVPGASGKIQKALLEAGAYTGNFRDAMAKGEITAEEFNKAVLGLGLTDVAAKAATSTKTIEGAVGNLQAVITGGLGSIITGIKPQITGVINGVADLAGSAFTVLGPKIVAGIQGAAKVVGPALSGILAAVQGKDLPQGTPPWVSGLVSGVKALGPVLTGVLGVVKPVLDALGPAVGQALGALGPIVAQLAEAFGMVAPNLSPLGLILQALAPVMPVVSAAFAQLATALGGTLSTVLATVVPLLVQLGGVAATTLVPVLSQVVTTLLPPLVGVITSVLGVVSQLLPVLAPVIGQIVASLLPAVGQLVTALLPVVVTALGAVQQIVVALAPVLTELAPLFAQLAQEGAQNLGNLSKVITALLPVVQSVFTTVVGVIKGALTIVQGVIQVVTGVISGDWSKVWTGIKNIVTGVWDVIKAVVVGAVRTVKTGIDSAMTAITGKVTDSWATVKAKFSEGVSAAVTYVKSLPGKAKSALSSAGTALLSAGRNLVQGFINGVTGSIGSVVTAAARVARAAVDAAKSALGIHSPSKVFYTIGDFVGKGFLQGLEGTEDEIKSATSKMMGYLSTEATNQAKLEASLRKKADKEKGKARKKDLAAAKAADAAEKRAIAARNIVKNLEYKSTTNAILRKGITDRLKVAQDELNERVKQYADYAESAASAARSYASITSVGTADTPQTSAGIVAGLRARLEAVRNYSDKLSALLARGLNKTTYDQLIRAGVEQGTDYVNALFSGADSDLRAVNGLQQSIDIAADSLGGRAAQAMYGAGVQAQQGIVDGLTSDLAKLEDASTVIAQAMVSAIKKALKIKSPSRVFRDLGLQTVAGLTIGLDDEPARRASTKLADAVTSGFGRPELAATVGTGYGSQAPIQYVINVDVPLGATKAEVGREITEALREFERTQGRR